jgi:hypothetical protein
MNKILAVILTFTASHCFAQTENQPKIFYITSAYSSFPDTARAAGNLYDKILYNAAEHYSDSTVMLVVPPDFKDKKKVDLVFWFHGWRNNIDSAAVCFELINQFIASHRNAILVLPETTKNAPDSYGGKLEQKEIIKNLLNDVLHKLKTEKIINKRTKTGSVVLAGHSGAFRVMAYILQNGGVEVNQVILFDGLYSQVDKYTSWIQANPLHQFINLYTNKGGGTDEISEKMMQLLREKNIPFINPEEKEVNMPLLKTNQIIFIHSLKEHNDVINHPDHNFRLYIESSLVLKPIK